MLSSGITIIAAVTRGTTSFFTGSAPSARMASICSVTFIAPTSAAMPLPMRPPDDDRGERGRELAREGEADDARDVLDAAEALQAEGELDGHDHADEERRHRDDAHRADAEGLHLVHRRLDLERPPGGSTERRTS